MSLHSNIQSQNQHPSLSHRNQPHQAPAPHSQTAPAAAPPQKEWVATYLEGQYYLTDPQSISKLKNIQAQIEKERSRLAKLEQDTLSHNNSFLSFQEDHADRLSNKSFCTEFDQSRHFSKQEKVKNDLEKEEEQYREKLRLHEREKIELKKNMKPSDKKETENVVEAPSPSRKRSSIKEKAEQPVLVEVQKSAKISKKASQEQQKEKSYHKSRIQKSIKESGNAIQALEQQSPQKSIKASIQNEKSVKASVQDQKSVKASVKEPKQQEPVKEEVSEVKEQTDKSIHIVVVQPDKSILPNEEQAAQSAKASHSPQKSVKASVKASEKLVVQQSAKEVEASVKGQLQKPAASQKSMKVKEVSVKASEKPVPTEKSVKNEGTAVIDVNDVKSVKAASVRLNADEALNNSPPKSQKSNQLHTFLQVQQPKHSEKKSIKQSEKAPSEHPSQKAESVKASQRSKKQADILSERPKVSEKAPSQHPREPSHKQASQVQAHQQAKSSRSPSVRASSKHSKARQLEKSIKLSQQLNAVEIVVVPQEDKRQQSVKASVKEVAQPKEQTNQVADKVSQKSIPRSVKEAPKQEVAKSQKSSKVIQEDNASRKSNNVVVVDESKSQRSAIKSEKVTPVIEGSIKSERIEQAEVASRKSSKKSHHDAEEVASKKSKQSSVKEEIISKKSQPAAKVDDVVSQKSAKASSKKEQAAVIPANSNQAIQSKSVVSQRRSFSKKSSAQVVQAKQTAKAPTQQKMDRSIQWSRVTSEQQNNPATVQIHQTSSELQNPSMRQSSFLNEESIKESSRVNVEIHQLKPEVKEAAPQYDMRKRKDDNQSEKKSRSFVIHSRNGSVKDKLSNSQISSPSRKSKDISSVAQSVTKGEILKLHQQIALLQDKLKKVEERQEQMQKFEGTLSKIQLQEQKQKKTEQVDQIQQKIEQKVEEVKQEQVIKPSQVQLPVVDLTEVQVRIQPRLQIQSSILQVNTLEEVRKQQEKETENGQKAKLKEEISRLKRIIRDMQIQKIRSIDLEAEDITPQGSRIQKQSISSYEGTQPRRFGSTNKRLLEDAGKIVHNSSGFQMETPRRKSVSKLRVGEDESEIADLPPDSSKRSKGKLYVEARRGELVSRIGQKQKDFHSFIESSRVIAEETGRTQPENNPLKNFSKVTVAQDQVDYSRLVQEMRKPNPEEEEVLPQVHLRDLQMPSLPDGPHAGQSQEELLSLARATYLAFGVDVEAQGRQLCVKKYKNCVIFSLDGQHHQCVLWHFSGKFYMGSWRAGEPGEGEKDGQGLEIVPGKHIYKGQFLTGKRHGSGILKQANGNIYDGQWADGVKSGRGVYLDAATRVLYSGQWRDNRKEGQGFLKLSEKEYYFGTFVRSIKEGFGVQVFVNGDKYRGEYKAGKFHGRGKYLWANGSCYEGQFHQGVRHGQGSWRSARNNPDIYIGAYDKDKKTGYGRYVWANGCMYQGGFANDLKHGKGRLTYQDGKQIKGIWEEGNLVSTEPQKKPADHEDQPLRRSVKVSAFLPASAKRI